MTSSKLETVHDCGRKFDENSRIQKIFHSIGQYLDSINSLSTTALAQFSLWKNRFWQLSSHRLAHFSLLKICFRVARNCVVDWISKYFPFPIRLLCSIFHGEGKSEFPLRSCETHVGSRELASCVVYSQFRGAHELLGVVGIDKKWAKAGHVGERWQSDQSIWHILTDSAMNWTLEYVSIQLVHEFISIRLLDCIVISFGCSSDQLT